MKCYFLQKAKEDLAQTKEMHNASSLVDVVEVCDNRCFIFKMFEFSMQQTIR